MAMRRKQPEAFMLGLDPTDDDVHNMLYYSILYYIMTVVPMMCSSPAVALMVLTDEDVLTVRVLVVARVA